MRTGTWLTRVCRCTYGVYSVHIRPTRTCTQHAPRAATREYLPLNMQTLVKNMPFRINAPWGNDGWDECVWKPQKNTCIASFIPTAPHSCPPCVQHTQSGRNVHTLNSGTYTACIFTHDMHVCTWSSHTSQPPTQHTTQPQHITWRAIACALVWCGRFDGV